MVLYMVTHLLYMAIKLRHMGSFNICVNLEHLKIIVFYLEKYVSKKV
jgi:hypothetical protein